MSGTEAFAVLGIISSIITIVETTKKICDAAQHSSGLHDSFRKIAESIPIVLRTLRTIGEIQEAAAQESRYTQSDEKLQELAETTKFVYPVVLACKTKAQDLQEIFEKCLPVAGASRAVRFSKAFRSVTPGLRKKVELMFKDILDKMQLLANHQMFENAVTSFEINTTLQKFYRKGSLADDKAVSAVTQRLTTPSASGKTSEDHEDLNSSGNSHEHNEGPLLGKSGHQFTYNNADTTRIANQGSVVIHGGQAITL
ncbi:hypothetical protein CERZMDRAFT_103664 [Cercospora zeae-maydis SCOH1-5]|uniref:NACHT-NTPase and P-loop NTPases N-terminal domain-containing protein n=1 Tax=Cercospora zeae-maydis SCOH1-5 TaxID=717836 RepID=A0A6A6EV76_9PEZI|nr:hypothetical protein CERZMDRAFT_103664 [Cercospora zeae-maydis SCOH1-5]